MLQGVVAGQHPFQVAFALKFAAGRGGSRPLEQRSASPLQMRTSAHANPLKPLAHPTQLHSLKLWKLPEGLRTVWGPLGSFRGIARGVALN